MGDVLSLVEEISKKVDHKKAQKNVQKMVKGRFDLDDMRDQVNANAANGWNGGFNGQNAWNGAKMPQSVKNQVIGDTESSSRMVAIINSMTPKERNHVNLNQGLS